MKIMNINLHFQPQSIGGATVVAEKLAWGLTQAGHEVTNVYLSLPSDSLDFETVDTPFGRSIGIKNIHQSPANRYVNSEVTSLLNELYSLLEPERIFVHAVQHMGIHAFLRDPEVRARTCIIAHDFYWVCLQGFRQLPDGSHCELQPGALSCRQCAWFPGLIDQTYTDSRNVLSSCRAVIFPSNYLHNEYVRILGETPENFVVQSNPDIAELIISDPALLPEPPGRAAKDMGKTVFGFVGGPGETKGWQLVRDFMERAKATSEQPDGPHVVLYDIGRSVNAPWYPGIEAPGISVVDAFHWSFGAHALGMLDVLLMPSRVRESFGLAAREALSLGQSCIIRPSGALAELQGHLGVVSVDDNDSVDSVMAKLKGVESPELKPWGNTSTTEYAERLISL